MTKIICNCCGKEIQNESYNAGLSIHKCFGYGSKYDSCAFDLDLCSDCADKVIDVIRPLCKEDPITI